ncbi:MAG: HAD family hydrolase [Gammaproteobacteria bacterium]|nr:HAD family hydrolase [Gammaproteobacteria bacterium]
MTYNAILFDKDGTLIEFNATWLPVYKNAAMEFTGNDTELADALLGEHGYDHDSNRFIGGSLLAAGSNRDIASAWCKQLGEEIDGAMFEVRYQYLGNIFQQQAAEHVTPVVNLKQTLTELKRSGLKLGVATSDSFAGIHKTLQAFDVLDQFDFLCGYDSGHGIKPNAGMVHAFCESQAVVPAQTIVIGDNKHDIEMGRNAEAGLCIGVLTGTSTRAELETIADLVYDDISGLPELFGDDR